jgi:RNA polymerase sigma factor (sigma-70 family)
MDERRRRFEELVLPHLDAAANLARWLTRSDAAADDIVQDAMLRAFRSFDRFQGGSAKPWLLAIVRNCHVDTMNARKRYTALPEDHAETACDPGPDPEADTLRAEQSRGLTEAVAQLPREFRETLILREMEEMSYRDIAAVTGVPIGTVMSRLARARALLRETWLARETAP